ncbi:MAG: uroporphyrinogen-III synthase [Ilumatobacteraceae bacterium]
MNALAGRTIVITRSAEQAAEMSGLVASFDAIPVIVPLIAVVDEPDGMAELASFDLARLDWIVVTSPNGAQRVAPLIPDGNPSPKVAAVGASTKSRLPRCDLVAETQSARGLLKRFPDGPGRVLVVQAVDAEPAMVQGLRERGWEVVSISPYRTVSATPAPDVQLAALAADAVLFASGSAARAWVEVFGLQTPPTVVAIGEQTAAAAQDAGLKVAVTSADHSVHGMLSSLRKFFEDRN